MYRLSTFWLAYSLLLSSCRGQPLGLNDWQNVRNLPPEIGILIQTKGGPRYHGELIRVTQDLISLDADERAFPGRRTRQRDLPRTDVQEIRKFNRAASTVAGTAIGAATGVGIGLAIDSSTRSNEDKGLATALFTIFGGLLGWGIGRHAVIVKGERVYVAP